MTKRREKKSWCVKVELRFEDINQLLSVLNKLVNEGNTVLVIEHNLDIIKIADHIIDMGPEGGGNGGEIVFKGSVKELINSNNKVSHTAKYLKKELWIRQWTLNIGWTLNN